MPHQTPDPPPADALAGAPYADGSYACNRAAGHAGVHHDSRSGATWAGVRPDPPPTLADQIRSIATTCTDGTTHGRLHDLADRVERYAAGPAEHELDAAGLDPEQEIRADALTAAARLLAPLLSQMSLSGAEANIDGIAAMWLRLADRGAGLIRDGSQPDHAICTCRRERSIAEPGQPLMDVRNPDCPLHGDGARP